MSELVIAFALLVVVAIFVLSSIKIVAQASVWICERMGRYHSTLQPGLNIVVPFIDHIPYKFSLKEVPLEVPAQVCITKDNTQLSVDAIIYFQVVDAKLAAYGSSNYVMAITQLAQTALRSIIGTLELDKTFQERESINHTVVSVLDQASLNWGVKVLRYEIKDLTPPEDILHAMQAQITAERQKRAVIAASEGKKQEQINLAEGEKQAAIQRSEGERQAAINRAQGEAGAIIAVAEATANAIQMVAKAARADGGVEAMNLKVAEQYVAAFDNLAKQGNTLILPGNLSDIGSLVSTALTVNSRPLKTHSLAYFPEEI